MKPLLPVQILRTQWQIQGNDVRELTSNERREVRHLQLDSSDSNHDKKELILKSVFWTAPRSPRELDLVPMSPTTAACFILKHNLMLLRGSL
mmetsp:Transcript_17058/g.25642  ORF Transcript_17058/g.25642 Transcript_17058/m.25642 type:complete len:92 (-) Transcript_17058:216-491(-)